MNKEDAMALLDAMAHQVVREPPEIKSESLARAFATVVSAEPDYRPEPWMPATFWQSGPSS